MMPLASKVAGLFSRSAPRWLSAPVIMLPAITTHPSCRMTAATRGVNGPPLFASLIRRQISSSRQPSQDQTGQLGEQEQAPLPDVGCSAHARTSPPTTSEAPGLAAKPWAVPPWRYRVSPHADPPTP